MNATKEIKMPRGGARTGAGRKPYPEFKPEGVVINVTDGGCIVSKWVRKGPAFYMQAARNYTELRWDAADEVKAVGGHERIYGIYPCSPELAAQADWSVQTEIHWMSAGWYAPLYERRGLLDVVKYGWRNSDRDQKPTDDIFWGAPEWFDTPPAGMKVWK